MSAVLQTSFLVLKSSNDWKNATRKVPTIGTFAERIRQIARRMRSRSRANRFNRVSLSDYFTSRPDFWARLRISVFIIATRTPSHPAHHQSLTAVTQPNDPSAPTNGMADAAFSSD